MATWQGMSMFTVELSDFSVSDLSVAANGEPRDTILKIGFDENYKLIQSQVESASRCPEYSIKETFNFRTRFVEKKKLAKKFMKIEVVASDTSDTIGACQVDLYTLACGPNEYELTLRNADETAGVVTFKCHMRMFSEVKLVLTKLRVDASNCEAGCKMSVVPMCISEELSIPYAKDCSWREKAYSITFDTHLGAILDPEEPEFVEFALRDAGGKQCGEARVPFRSHFSLNGQPIEFQAPIHYRDQTTGTLSGHLTVEHLPLYAQMRGATGRDDSKVHGGLLLYPGLPYPDFYDEPPASCPIGPPKESWRDGGRVAPETRPSFSPLQSQSQKVSYQVPLPPHWQRRFDRNTNLPYYADSRVKLTCWVDPRFLPPGWDQRIDPVTSKIYFADHKTKKTTFSDPRGCPPGWEMRLNNQDARPYFAFGPSRQTTYNDPRGCPPGTTPALDGTGKMYFRHHASRSTAWDDPRTGQIPEVLNMWRLQELQAWREAEIVRLEEEANSQQTTD